MAISLRSKPDKALPPKVLLRKMIEDPTQSQAESESDSNWIVSYADMVTLLMSFFALMFSFAKVDEKKFNEVREEVSRTFGGTYTTAFEKVDPSLLQPVDRNPSAEEIQVNEKSQGLRIVFKSALYFEAGTTDVKKESRLILDRVLDVLAKTMKDHDIYVEGHTDDSPIQTAVYPSNWELSAARASLVVRSLEKRGFPKGQLHPVGYGESQPLVPNRDSVGKPITENQAQNRRVVLRIVEKKKT